VFAVFFFGWALFSVQLHKKEPGSASRATGERVDLEQTKVIRSITHYPFEDPQVAKPTSGAPGKEPGSASRATGNGVVRYDLAGLCVGVGVDAEGFHFFVEGGAVDVEDLGGGGSVPVVGGQGGEDDLSFWIAEGVGEGHGCPLGCGV